MEVRRRMLITTVVHLSRDICMLKRYAYRTRILLIFANTEAL